MLVLLSACQAPSGSPALAATLPPQKVLIKTGTPSPVSTQMPAPTPTPILAIEELIYPYTIEGLREHEFQSGDIHIRETLYENEKYTSYLVDYPSDGLTITGVMQIPKGEGPFPVAVMNHGFYPRSIYRSGDGTDRASAFLAEHGYITLASDYRSWGASDLGYSFFYSGLVIDVINLINAIPTIPEADAERVVIWGHSMGGGVTIKVLTIIGGFDAASATNVSGYSTTVKVKAAVLYSTVSADDLDIINRWGIGCFGDVIKGETVYGCNSSDVIPLGLPKDLQSAYRTTASNADALKKVAAYYHLDYVSVPVQIHYGTEDGRSLSGTPPEWSLKLTQGLRDVGKNVELYQYDDEGHSFIGEPWFVFMRRVLRFFDGEGKNSS